MEIDGGRRRYTCASNNRVAMAIAGLVEVPDRAAWNQQDQHRNWTSMKGWLEESGDLVGFTTAGALLEAIRECPAEYPELGLLSESALRYAYASLPGDHYFDLWLLARALRVLAPPVNLPIRVELVDYICPEDRTAADFRALRVFPYVLTEPDWILVLAPCWREPFLERTTTRRIVSRPFPFIGSEQ
jgi:hypothetical protein